MGTKRVGLARVQALIENLKRELDLSSTTLKDAAQVRRVKEVSAATTLTNADSGALITLSGANYVVKLPKEPEVGCTYTFINAVALGAGGSVNIDAKDGVHFFLGKVQDREADASSASHVSFNGSSHDQLKFSASAGALDSEVKCTFIDNNTWLVHDSFSFDISDITSGTASTNA